MKKILILLCLLMLIGCKSKKVAIIEPKKTNFEKISFAEINDVQKNKAYDLGKRVLMTCNTSKFKPFNTTEATVSVIQNTTEERLTKTCTRFRQYYGTFKDLELVEVFKNNYEKTTIFRYKALYSKKVANKELRVSINGENKVSAIKSLDWVDSFSK